MLSVSCRAIAIIAVSLFLTGAVSAQTTTPSTSQPPKTVTTQTPRAATDATKAAPARSAVSQECSRQADAKGLHGKDRKHFRSECKRNSGKSG